MAAALYVQPSELLAVKREAISPTSKASVCVPGENREGILDSSPALSPPRPPENKVSNVHLPEHLTNPPRPTLGLLGAGTAGPEGFLRFLPWAGPAPWASALIPRGRGHRGGLANGRLELLLFFCWGRVPGAWSLKRSGTALPSPGWEGEEAESYVWVTWRLLVFGPDSAASAPGEEAVTTREAVVVAAAAGGREEVGLALRGV